MAKWDAALYSEKLLKQASLDLMWTPAKLNDGKAVQAGYGFGWMTGQTRGHRVVQHGGAWQGFCAHIARFVDKKLTVIVLTNLAGVNAGTIAEGIAGLYDPELAPIERTAIRIDPKIFDSYAGQYELQPGFVLTLSREGDKLWAQATNQPPIEIFAESETLFFAKALDAQLELVKDASGAVTHLILHQNGEKAPGKKIQ